MNRPWEAKSLDRRVNAARSSASSVAAPAAASGSGVKRERPADEEDVKPSPFPNDKINNGNDSHYDAPYVTVDGIKYYSDRFYLCRPSGLEEGDMDVDVAAAASAAGQTSSSAAGSASTMKSEQQQQKQQCTCGHSQPPPLLDRSRLIHSLVRGNDGGGGLKAAILATYTFDPYWMTYELPDLFPTPTDNDDDGGKERQSGAAAAMPTLVLHGHKGLRLHRRSRRSNKTKKEEDNTGKKSAKKEEEEEEEGETKILPNYAAETRRLDGANGEGKTVEVVCIDSDTDDDNDNGNNDDGECAKAGMVNDDCYNDDDIETDDEGDHREESMIKEEVKDEEDVPPEEGWRRDEESDYETDDDEGDKNKGAKDGNTTEQRRIFANSVHVTQVLPTWVPPPKTNGSSDRKGGNSARRASSGAGSASRPVTLVDSSDEEGKGKDNAIVIDSSDEEEDGEGDTEAKVKQDADSSAATASGSKSANDDKIDPSLCVDPEIAERRQGRVGVHHPKFMILVERRGSIVVVVTSTNLTRMGACEGMWLQRFEPRSVMYSGVKSEGSSPRNGDGGGGGVSSDFGRVLSDYLKNQSDACEPNRMTPVGFVRKYLGFHGGLDDLWQRYRFEEAQVHLIPTVPGDYGGRHTAAASKPSRRQGNGINRPMLYGPQRVADILAKSRRKDEKRGRSGMPPSFISTDSDRLTMQVTSFGGYWGRQNMEEIVRSYMGLDDRAKKKKKKNSLSMSSVKGEASEDENEGSEYRDVLDMLDIYWPSQSYFELMKQQQSKRRRLSEENEDDSNSYEKTDPMRGFYCFHSSQNFNTNDISVISRMVQYKTPVTPQFPLIICPHIKTVARLLGDYYKHDSRFEHAFSWFMLTSACLSRGAQGRIPEMRGFESDADAMSYANFELGVLFCSRTGGAPGSNRLYGFKPKTCGCTNTSGENTGNLVHLPVPYQLRAPPYQEDEDDATMSETPFFHELTEGIGGGGHMSLTPLGKELNAKIKACKN